jgi:hypothetical protein
MDLQPYLESIRAWRPELRLTSVEVNPFGLNNVVLIIDDEWIYRFPRDAEARENFVTKKSGMVPGPHRPGQREPTFWSLRLTITKMGQQGGCHQTLPVVSLCLRSQMPYCLEKLASDGMVITANIAEPVSDPILTPVATN